MRALLIDNNEDNRVVYRTIFEHLLPDLRVQAMLASNVVMARDAIDIVKAGYDFVLLPLSLPNFNSLRIAEFTHRLRSVTRLVLLTAAIDADRTALFQLYDTVLHRPIEPRRLVAAVQDLLSSEVDRTKSEEQIEEMLIRLLESATVFRIGRMGCDPGRPATLQDYHDLVLARTGSTRDMKESPADQRREKGRRMYDVALSFAGEDRTYVEQVAEQLRLLGVDVFYDRFEEVDLWGKDLAEHLGHVYGNDAHFVVLFLSQAYAAKAWPRHEKRFALARQISVGEERVLPVRFDDTEIPGLPDTVGYLDLRGLTPIRLAEMIRKKLDQHTS